MMTKSGPFMSLGGNSSQIDGMLAKLSAKAASNSAVSDYFAAMGKRQSECHKRKPINVTPSGNKPYCRHKDFQRMPKYSLDAVSINSHSTQAINS